MSASVTLSLLEVLGLGLAEAEGEVGDSAPALLLKAYAYAAERDTDGYLPSSVLERLTSHRAPRKVVAALVEAGALVAQGKGYRLARYLETNPSRARREATLEAERLRKRKGRADTTTEPTPDEGAESGAESGTPSTPESGAESGATSGPPLSGSLPSPELNSGEKTPGSDAGRPAPPGVSLPDSGSAPGADSGAPPTRAVTRKAAGAAALQELIRAYAAGVTAVTGVPCSPPDEAWNQRALEAMAALHSGGLVGPQLAEWVRTTAQAYVTARREVTADQSKGFSPERCKSWLDAGSPAAPSGPSSARGSRTTPVQPSAPKFNPRFKPLDPKAPPAPETT